MSKVTVNILGKEVTREMKEAYVEKPGVFEISYFPPKPGGLLIREEDPDGTFVSDVANRSNELLSDEICVNRSDGTCKLTGNYCDDYEAMFCGNCSEE